MRLDPNTARTMTAVTRKPTSRLSREASRPMLDLLDRVKAGAVLVTSRGPARPLRPEVDGEPVPATTARGLIVRGLVVEASRTAGTTTWRAAEQAAVPAAEGV